MSFSLAMWFSKRISICLPSAAGRMESMAAWMTAERVLGWTASRSLPVMMRDTSRRSSISFVCARTLRSITSRAPCRSARDPAVPERSRRVQPRIAASGVRSSWESVVRNSSFMRLASRASALTAFSMAIELIWASCVSTLASSSRNSPSHFSSTCRRPIGRPSRPVSGAASHPSRPGRSAAWYRSCSEMSASRGRRAGPLIVERSATSDSRSRSTGRSPSGLVSSDRAAALLAVVHFSSGRRDGHGLVDAEDVPGEVRDDLRGSAPGDSAELIASDACVSRWSWVARCSSALAWALTSAVFLKSSTKTATLVLSTSGTTGARM